jgi:flavin reductase (DIM6/NTAB) family NADH-FMN oxidoreductase RutF
LPAGATQSASASPGFTSEDFRGTLGAFATGVTIVTTRGEEHPYGMTANAFSSVSLDPPLVLVCVKAFSEGADLIRENGIFAVNILAAEQEPLSRYFASKDRPRGRDAFADIAHKTAASGSPVLEGSVGYLDCSLHETHDAGDHVIVIGEVLALEYTHEVAPLLFHGGGYRYVKDS